MHFADPFSLPGRWFKGGLHIHSTASDGELTPDEVVDWYRSRGYHFLALTDHGVLSKAGSFSAGGAVSSEVGDFIALSGIEVGGTDPQTGLYHLVGLGLNGPLGLREGGGTPLQEAINEVRTAGGLVFLAHPYWTGQMSRDLLELEGCCGLEVYNGGCEVLDGRGFSNVHWDDLLAAGRRLWGLAVDDAHWRPGPEDADLGWVWVKAPALTQEAILSALEQGSFYSSSGPQIESLRLEGKRLRVSCSPVVAIDFIGDQHSSRRVLAPPGETMTAGSYRLKKRQRYVRVACQDAQGYWAWSNPIFLDGMV